MDDFYSDPELSFSKFVRKMLIYLLLPTLHTYTHFRRKRVFAVIGGFLRMINDEFFSFFLEAELS